MLQAEARLLKEARELEEATFAPSLSPESKMGTYVNVKPRINLRNPEQYQAELEERRRKEEERRQEAIRQREVG